MFIQQRVSVLDNITSVTYGGKALSRVTEGTDSAGEPGRAYVYFLGSGIPAGAQNLIVAFNDGVSADYDALFATVTAAGDTAIAASGALGGDQADPQIALDSGAAVALRYCGILSGVSYNNLTPVAGMTALQDNPRSLSAMTSRLDRQTDPSSGSFAIGYTALSDDVAMTAVAIKELPAAGGSPVFLIQRCQPQRGSTTGYTGTTSGGGSIGGGGSGTKGGGGGKGGGKK